MAVCSTAPVLSQTAASCGLQVAELWADYFVFTATRNPFSRAVAQYRTALLSNLGEPAECAALVSWPSLLLGAGMTGGVCCRDTASFNCPCLQAEELNWDSFCDSPRIMLTFCARHPSCCLNANLCALFAR